MNQKISATFICLGLLVSASQPVAAERIRSERIQFEAGMKHASVKGRIKGREIVDYKVNTHAAQTMTVALKAATPSLYFNVLPPESEKALFVGSRDGSRFEGKLTKSGDVTVRLYLMGNARDIDAAVDYELKIELERNEEAAGRKNFEQTLSLQGVTFHLRVAETSDGKRELILTPSGLRGDNATIKTPINGTLTGAEVGDLNVDGSPEIYVYLQMPGEEARGTLLAWSANNKKSLTQIYLPELPTTDPKMIGYHGHDEFALVENVLVRRFPIPDKGATSSSRMRQFQYKLRAGEAGWVLRLDKSIEF